MGRAAGLILLMVGFAASAVAFVQHARSGDLPGHVDRVAERRAAVKAATLELETAARTLEQAHRLMGSYADADLRIFRGLTVVRADETSFCIQVVAGDGALLHEAGPGGAPAAGPC